MIRRLLCALLALALPALGPAGAAAQLRVAADIPPVHGLVARVMEGVGAPALALGPGAGPHGHALRPSEARALAEADLIVWIGPELTPWLARALPRLAPEARRLTLMELAATRVLPVRQARIFDLAAAEGAGPGGASGGFAAGFRVAPGGGDPAVPGPAEGARAADAAGDLPADPHAWLDPTNARAWLAAIAETLAAADPAHAARYRANAASGADEIARAAEAAAARLAPVRTVPFIVTHDAFQYLEARFGLRNAGALAGSDAERPGPARMAEIRAAIADHEVGCVVSEAPLAPEMVATLFAPSKGRNAVLDPLGAGLPPGPGHYPALLHDLSSRLATCQR